MDIGGGGGVEIVGSAGGFMEIAQVPKRRLE